MESLSAEVLMLIFNGFNFEQKVNCMLVCSQWARILLSPYETESVEFNFNKLNLRRLWNSDSRRSWKASKIDDRPKSLMEQVDNSAGYGMSCKRLSVLRMDNYLADYVAFAKHFPNVEEFTLQGSDYEYFCHSKPFSEDQCVLLQSWRSNLRTIHATDFKNDFFYFLQSGVFKSLSALTISAPYSARYSFFTKFSEVLDNICHLTELSFEHHSFEVNDLEMIHEKLQKLTSLSLDRCPLTCRKGMPIDIKPSNNIRSVALKRSRFDESEDTYEYIIAKYCRVKEFSFIVEVSMKNEEALKQVEVEIGHIISGIGQNLTSLELNVFHKENLFKLFNAKGLECLKANLFLSNPRLKRLFSSSEGLQNIRILSLTEVPRLNFTIFNRLKALKELELNFKEKRGIKFPVELDTVLSRHLSMDLELLRLGYARIYIGPDKQTPPFTSKINTLQFKRSELSETLADYLAQHMKDLDYLYLLDCKIKHHRSGNNSFFELPNSHLSLVKITLDNEFNYTLSHRSYREKYILPNNLKVTIGDETCCFEEKDKVAGFSSYFYPQPFDDQKEYFHFKCAHLKKLYCNDSRLV